MRTGAIGIDNVDALFSVVCDRSSIGRPGCAMRKHVTDAPRRAAKPGLRPQRPRTAAAWGSSEQHFLAARGNIEGATGLEGRGKPKRVSSRNRHLGDNRPISRRLIEIES